MKFMKFMKSTLRTYLKVVPYLAKSQQRGKILGIHGGSGHDIAFRGRASRFLHNFDSQPFTTSTTVKY